MCALYIYIYTHHGAPRQCFVGRVRSSMIPGQNMIDGKMISTAKPESTICTPGAVIHLDSPDEAAPMGNENLEIQPKRLHSWAGGVG